MCNYLKSVAGCAMLLFWLASCGSDGKYGQNRDDSGAKPMMSSEKTPVAPEDHTSVDESYPYTWVEGTGLTTDPDDYTYTYADEPRPTKPRKMVYDVSQVDRPPLFGEGCLNKKSPYECSNTALQDYFAQNVDYPEAAERRGANGKEYVTFTVQADGSVAQDFEVVTREERCEGCAQAAVNAIAAMPKWTPAMKNGKPVAVKLVLPVRFSLEGTY